MKLDPLEGTDDIFFIKLSLIEKKNVKFVKVIRSQEIPKTCWFFGLDFVLNVLQIAWPNLLLEKIKNEYYDKTISKINHIYRIIQVFTSCRKLSDTKGGIFLNDPILDCLEWCDVDDVPSSTYK
ncbi:hypothetical protein RhiirA5_425973 [Rhizophagus irregularis]|uniref:Uncharacterized protein n=1 Tax=Rhizophagus irregularis TaxID=588596 RepID=A0A2N0P526_9GLOM|nr:hypothetical protein RhiirA5_425973 [Rhizophagus irregularis]